MDRVGILVPCYNNSATIAQTLSSIQAQAGGLGRIELVALADDGSVDNTIPLAVGCWSSPTELRILNSPRNLGERGNVNRAIESLGATIGWLLILHADDIAKPNWLSVMLDRIDHQPKAIGSICASWDDWMADDTIVAGEDRADLPVHVIEGGIDTVRGTLRRGCWWHISGCAIRLQAFREVGPFHEGMPQLGDWEWLLRLLSAGWSIEYVPQSLILYRNHAASVSSTSFRTDRDLRESIHVARGFRHFMSSRDLTQFHAKRMMVALRRLAKASARLDLAKIMQVLKTEYLLSRNWLSLLPVRCGQQ